MASATTKIVSNFTSNALDLLDCFANEFDEVVGRMAESVAKKRTAAGTEVTITADDISAAADTLAKAMKASSLSPDVKQDVDLMLECLSEKRRNG